MSKSDFQRSGVLAENRSDDIAIRIMPADLVRQAAKLHTAALAGSRSAIMGQSYASAFIDFFRGLEHGGVALMACDRSGALAGYVIGAPLGYPAALSRFLRWTSVAAFAARPWVVFRRAFRDGFLDRIRLRLGWVAPRIIESDLPPPTMSLVAIAVHPSARGKKVGMRLVQAFELKAREVGMRSLRLSMQPDNHPARRLYERCGWHRYFESPELAHYCKILE
jgi:ribosomal protein S18 acetylase RimI-like enzyme